MAVLTLLVYADTLRRLFGQTLPPAAKTHTAFVVSVYPVSHADPGANLSRLKQCLCRAVSSVSASRCNFLAPA